MNNVYIANAFRFFFLLLIQGLVLKGIELEHINIFLYPLFIMLLPLELPHGLVVLAAFMMGLSVDMFYDSFGLHAAALVAVAFARPLLCALVEPRGGYEVGQSLTKHSLGFRWFLRYSAIISFAHILVVASLEDLSIGWLWFSRIVIGFVLSLFLVILYQFIFNPKQ
jgi:hypothetical protein